MDTVVSDGDVPSGFEPISETVAVYEGAECDAGDDEERASPSEESASTRAQWRARRIHTTMARIRNFHYVKSNLSVCSFGAVV